MCVVMYAVDGAALSDGRADTKQSDGPRYPATDASSGQIYSEMEPDRTSENCLFNKHDRVRRLANIRVFFEFMSLDIMRLNRYLMNDINMFSRDGR